MVSSLCCFTQVDSCSVPVEKYDRLEARYEEQRAALLSMRQEYKLLESCSKDSTETDTGLLMKVKKYTCIYLFVYLSIYPSIYVCIYVRMYVSIYPSIYPSIRLSIFLSTYLSIYLYLCLYIYMCVYIYLCICMYIQSVYLYIYYNSYRFGKSTSC